MKLRLTRAAGGGWQVQQGKSVLHREMVGDSWTAAIRWARKFVGR